MRKILISGLGGSLFPYLHDKLKSNYELFYVDLDPELAKLYKDYNFFPAPAVLDQSYEVFIENLIKKNKIDIYIPLIDEEIKKAHQIKKLFPELLLVVPTLEFSELCLNKDKLMHKLSELNISEIQTKLGDELTKNENFPVFVKPTYGRGSRGIRVINSLKEFEAYLLLDGYKANEVIVQDNIQGTEYTVGVLSNNMNQILSISSKKVISKKGITIQAVTENNESIEDVVLKINEKLKPCGPYNVQLFIDNNNRIKIFEINPRFSTTSIMSYEGGVNEIDLFDIMYGKTNNSNFVRPKAGITLRRSWKNNFYD
jgi:carbamoyl-phosphate synthase large subunit